MRSPAERQAARKSAAAYGLVVRRLTAGLGRSQGAALALPQMRAGCVPCKGWHITEHYREVC